jgi:hypothetical protein
VERGAWPYGEDVFLLVLRRGIASYTGGCNMRAGAVPVPDETDDGTAQTVQGEVGRGILFRDRILHVTLFTKQMDIRKECYL